MQVLCRYSAGWQSGKWVKCSQSGRSTISGLIGVYNKFRLWNSLGYKTYLGQCQAEYGLIVIFGKSAWPIEKYLYGQASFIRHSDPKLPACLNTNWSGVQFTLVMLGSCPEYELFTEKASSLRDPRKTTLCHWIRWPYGTLKIFRCYSAF